MKNIITYFILGFFILVGGTVYAQEARGVKIKLNNGHTLSGKLVEYQMDKSVTIEVGEGQILTFQMDEIKDLDMEDMVIESPYSFRETGFYNRTSISALTGESSTGFSINHTVSYQLNRKLGIGIGGGVDNYYSEDGYNIIPVFAEVKSYILARNRTPYVAIRGGYAFASPDEEIGQLDASGGYMVNPSVGYRLTSRDFMVDIFVGIKVQKSDYEYRDFETRIYDDITYKRVDIGLGFMF